MRQELCNTNYHLYQCFPNIFARGPFFLRKIATDPHSLIECTDYRYQKLDIYISEPILDGYEYVPVAYVKIQCTT